MLGVESGIQDQLSAAFGGINYIEIDRYPDATVRSLPVWDELGSLLTLVFLGRAHDSSSVHRQVIDKLGDHERAVFSRFATRRWQVVTPSSPKTSTRLVRR